MNPDEIKNALTTLAIGIGSSWAASHGIDQATISSTVGAVVALAAGVYSVASHWNMIKVPETSTTVTPATKA